MDRKNEIATQYLNMGIIFGKKNQHLKAIEFQQRALKLFQESNLPHDLSAAHYNLGASHLAIGKLELARYHGEKALPLAQTADAAEVQKNIHHMLHATYKQLNMPYKALDSYERFIYIRDSINSDENREAILRQEYSFEYQKQKEIDDLENRQALELEKSKRRNQQLLSLAIAIGLGIISVLAIINFRRLQTTRTQKALIEEQKIRVEQSEKYKEQFLANMSHEIRTPMHAISGMLNILQRNPHLKEQETYLHAMQSSSENLLVILNDVLDLSKIEAGKLNIEQVPLNPRTLLTYVEQLMRYKAEEKGLKLELEVSEPIPELIMGDPTRLSQILTNLTGNAIKFTDKGEVQIKLKAQDEWLHFEVSDTGRGIPEDQLDRIFNSFEQADQEKQKYRGGTGLGLSISRQLVQLQGGKIWAESERGKGSTFFVELPLIPVKGKQEEEEILTEQNLKEMAVAMKGIKILLVEDNPFNRMIATDDLNYYLSDHHIDEAQHGQEALDLLSQNTYDIVLMDAQMPVMNGFETTRAIRAQEVAEGLGNRISIIAMTASLLKHELDKCYESGMDDYIPKPYQAEELIGRMYKQLV